MNKCFSVFTTLVVLISSNLFFAHSAYAYGGSPRAPACKKPVVTVLSPAVGSGATSVSAGSEFSFEVSSDAKEKAISMSAKDISIPVQISKQSNGKLKVTGSLPASLTDGYASVALTAPAGNGQCSGLGKVLVQIN